MPMSDIVSNLANLRQKWSAYKDNIESKYGKKRMNALEVSHYLFTNSLFNNSENNNNNSETDLTETMAIIESSLRYEYFRDGFKYQILYSIVSFNSAMFHKYY